MKVTSMTKARPDMGRRPQTGVEDDDEAQEKGSENAAGDIYSMLGYRALRTTAITTQQWLAFRLIEL